MKLANKDNDTEVGGEKVKEKVRTGDRVPREETVRRLGDQFDGEKDATGGEGNQEKKQLKRGDVKKVRHFLPGEEHD